MTELGQHGADGLVTILLFVVLLVATRLGVGPCITLPGMVLCGGFYFLLRTAERQHAVRLADLSLKTEAARVSAITDSYRAQTANREQPGLPFGSRSDG